MNTGNADSQILLRDVQMNRVFPDGKTFPDCIPKEDPEEINKKYILEKELPGFDLKNFVLQHYSLPAVRSNNYTSDVHKSVEENIERLWSLLTREPEEVKGTLIPLPYPYIVPGGRFGEIYYWDSYFTMQGLLASGKNGMIENMVKNFSYLIDRIGYIPNGNRTYFIGRSQPPFYSLMVKLLAGIRGDDTLKIYLPQLMGEYQFWMRGSSDLSDSGMSVNHSCRMPDGEIMNRYWDENKTPRPESFREDVELSRQSRQDPEILFRHLRAGAESGWDYSSRWFKEKNSFATIHTTEIVPVDLNCLLFHLEQTISEAFELTGDQNSAADYGLLAKNRKDAILKYCWNETRQFFVDFDIREGRQKQAKTLAGVSPLFFGLATGAQARQVAVHLENEFLKAGGLLTTLETTGQQWDAPNGWAPLQWMAIAGLENYGLTELATTIAKRWIRLNSDVFRRTGKLMEKYNVEDTALEAGGGEYPGQDGFGWTNGVLLALIKKYGTS